jgi:hypothetical protein
LKNYLLFWSFGGLIADKPPNYKLAIFANPRFYTRKTAGSHGLADE